MQHTTRRKTCHNADGTVKTIDQLMRSTLTILQYGRYIAATQQSPKVNHA